MSRPMTYEGISELDEELCKYCRCTDYGLDMKAKNGYMGVYYGCEGMFCDEAYENYLDEYEGDINE